MNKKNNKKRVFNKEKNKEEDFQIPEEILNETKEEDNFEKQRSNENLEEGMNLDKMKKNKEPIIEDKEKEIPKSILKEDALLNILEDFEEAKKKAEESEKRFKDIALSSSEFVWEADKNGKYTFISGKIKDFLGYNPEEVVGKYPFSFMPKNEAKKIKQVFQKIVNKKENIINLETINLTKNKKEVLMLTNGVVILDDKNNVLGYRGVNKNITKEKKIEEELKLFKQGFESSPNSMVLVEYINKNPKILRVNKSFTKYYGYNEKEVLNKNPRVLQSKKYNHNFYKNIWESILNPKIGKWSGKIINKTKNGNFIDVILSISTIFDVNKKPKYFIANHVDITENKKVKRIFKENEEKYKTIFESSPEAIVLINKSGIILNANYKIKKWLGYKAEEVIGKNVLKSRFFTKKVKR